MGALIMTIIAVVVAGFMFFGGIAGLPGLGNMPDLTKYVEISGVTLNCRLVDMPGVIYKETYDAADSRDLDEEVAVWFVAGERRPFMAAVYEGEGFMVLLDYDRDGLVDDTLTQEEWYASGYDTVCHVLEDLID